MKCDTASEAETEALAARLARLCRSGDTIGLIGTLGMGKTCFARGFIRALTGITGAIPSPTYTLVQTYSLTGGGQLLHVDGYRLNHPSELEELGLDEAEGRILLMEWPELYLPQAPDALKVRFAMGQGPHARELYFESDAPAWHQRLETLTT